jgi:hypothetical protein
MADSYQPQSEARVKKIKSIVETYKKAGVKFDDPKIQASIYNDVAGLFPIDPKAPADTRSNREISDDIRKDALKNGVSDNPADLRKKAESEAAKIYALSRPMDYVTVRYQKGEKLYTAEGVYYGYGFGEKSVRVGDQYIALFDMLPDSRIKFDKAYCKQKEQEYIESALREHYQQKTAKTMELLRGVREEQLKRNEGGGYIWLQKEWIPGRKVVEMQIAAVIKEERDKALAEKGLAPDPAQPETTAKTGETAETAEAGRKDPLEEINKKYQEIRKKISNTYAGIDADQGYRLALWGMTREEVDIILDNDKSLDKDDNSSKPPVVDSRQKDQITLEFSDGWVSQVTLMFHQNLFYKVVVKFNVSDAAAMQRLINTLNERYGSTDEQKALKSSEGDKSAPKAPTIDDAERADDPFSAKSDKKKSQVAAGPVEMVYHWTGKVTNGIINIKLTSDRTAYSEFTLTKESPEIRERAEAQALKEQQKQRDIQRLKEVEQMSRKKIDF